LLADGGVEITLFLGADGRGAAGAAGGA